MQHYIDSVTAFNGDKVTDAIISVTTLAGNAVTIYLDEAGLMPVASVSTNSNGEFDFYVPSGRYNISVSGSGITAYILSDVFIFYPNNDVIPVISGGTGVTTSTGTGSVVLNTTPTLVTPILGTPTSGDLTNCTIPVGSITGTLPVLSGGTGVTTSTGTGAVVLNTSPTLVTPLLGTPTSGTLTTCTGLPLTTGVTGTLPVANGGTGITSAGTLGNVLTSDGTAWQSSAAASQTTFSAGTTGFTPSTATHGAVTLAGTLVVANGGTGVTASTGTGSVVLGTSPTLTSPIISGTPTGVGTLTSGTAVASTSGTSIDFTSIPSWVKRITVMFTGVSTNSTSNLIIQLGSTTFTTSGYTGYVLRTGPSSSSYVAYSSGFLITDIMAATYTMVGHLTLTNITSDTWVGSGISTTTSAINNTNVTTGSVPLGGTLDRVRITTVIGTNTFDAGTINIMYE